MSLSPEPAPKLADHFCLKAYIIVVSFHFLKVPVWFGGLKPGREYIAQM
jgi:hypothetical protein